MEQPTDNVKLTFDQLQALDVAQKRLAVIESEINNANKVLRGTSLEVDRAIKAKAYEEEILAEITRQYDEKQKSLTVLDEQLLKSSDILAHLNSDIATKSASQSIKDSEFKDREDLISQNENDLMERDSKISAKEKALDTALQDFNTKVAKLKEVISQF